MPLSVSMLVPKAGPLAKPVARLAGKLPWARIIRRLNQQRWLAPLLNRMEQSLHQILQRRAAKAAKTASAAEPVQFYPAD